mgnify:CR=1 FL=1
MKGQTNFRLSETTRRQLRDLAAAWNMSQAEVIAALTDRAHKAQKKAIP